MHANVAAGIQHVSIMLTLALFILDMHNLVHLRDVLYSRLLRYIGESIPQSPPLNTQATSRAQVPHYYVNCQNENGNKTYHSSLVAE